MKPVTIYKLDKKEIEWYFTDDVTQGEQVWIADNETNGVKSIGTILDVIKETETAYYITLEE